MKNFNSFLNEELTRQEIGKIEKFADKLFATVGIDVDLSGRHFFDRVNDRRNGKAITNIELIDLFNKVFKKYGKKISSKNPGFESVLKDLNSDINLPFMLKFDAKNGELDMIAKTVMRKKNFKSTSSMKVY